MENTKGQNPTQGFKIIIAVLAVVAATIAILFYVNVDSLKKEAVALNAEKVALQSNIKSLNAQLSTIKSQNEALNASLEAEKARVKSLMEQLDKEKATNRAAVNRYTREINNLRALVKNYAEQIEELKAANVALHEENYKVREELIKTTLRAEVAEIKVKDLTEKVAQGSHLVAREIELVNIKGNEKETARIKRARKLKVDFTIVANEIAPAGERTVYARLIGPDGYLLTENSKQTFNANGQNVGYTASRKIDYVNADLSVSVYLDGVKGLEKGTYSVEIYMDGQMIGKKEIVTK